MFTLKLRQLADFFVKAGKKISLLIQKVPLKRVVASFLALSRKEKVILGVSLCLLLGGTIFAVRRFYLANTVLLPKAGGIYTEGVIGIPEYINPLLPDTSQADTILESLIFSSLFRVDGSGNLQNDLAESLEEIDNGQVYLVSLRENLTWHDNQPLTAQDVLFTTNLIKNPELQHPLGQFFENIEVEAISSRTLKFTLAKPYLFFPHYLTFKIIPKHLWDSIPVTNFIFSSLNLKSIGSGPYQLRKVIGQPDAPEQYRLTGFSNYYLDGPYLSAIIIRFFDGEQQALNALRKKEINGLGNLPLNEIDNLVRQANYRLINPATPEYFGIFFNEQLEMLQDLQFKQALEATIDKTAIVNQIFNSQAEAIDSPLWNESESEAKLNPALAKELLGKLGWRDSDEDGILDKKISRSDKISTPLEISLTTLDTPENVRLSELIQLNLQEVGIRLIVKNLDLNEFNSRLRSGSFQLLLLGESTSTGKNQDFYPFLHSEQNSPAGMNFSHYRNIELDKILNKLRQEEATDLAQAYSEISRILKQDLPAIFLYRPKRYFAVSDYLLLPEMKFIQSDGERLSRINEWHILTQRVWK